jgi:penicillin-binding protein 1A
VFIGFDDNRSLGEGEVGGVSALPVFINFMTEAIKGVPVEAFKPPKTAKFAVVGGQREAFRPGTEPRGPVGPVAPVNASGPVTYQDAWPGGQISSEQPAAPKPAPKPKIPDDLTGLY